MLVGGGLVGFGSGLAGARCWVCMLVGGGLRSADWLVGICMVGNDSGIASKNSLY